MSFLPPSSLLDSAYSRVARPHACTAHATELLRPATAIATAGGFVFTPVYAPLVAEDDAAISSNGSAQSISATALAQHALHSTPYGVSIHMHPATSSPSQLGGNEALASVVAAGGEFDASNPANSDELLEPPFLIGGHEQPVQAIAAIELRSERRSGRNQDEDEEQCEAEDDVADENADTDCVSDVLLVTCSSDRLMIWHLSEILFCLSASPPRQPTGRALPLSYEVHRMHIDESGSKLALCLASAGVVVVDLESGTVEAVLEGHAGRVNGAPFLPASYLPAGMEAAAAGTVILTYGQDRTFKLWNLTARRLLYTSAIVSASPFVQHCWDPPPPAAAAAAASAAPSTSGSSMARFILGSEDGKMRHYDLSKLVPHMVAALAPSPSSSSSAAAAVSAVPLQGTIVRLIHTVDVAALQSKLFRAHTRAAEEARRKAAAIQAQGKVIRANNSSNAEPSYNPFLATESNMPGGSSNEDGPDTSSTAADADAPPSILALYYPLHLNARVGTEADTASWVPPTGPAAAAPAAAAASAPAAPRRSPSASPSRSPSAPPALSPSASPSALSLSSLSATADTLYAVTSKGVSRINTRTYEVEWTAGFCLADESEPATASAVTNLSVLSVGVSSLACFLEASEMDALASECELFLALTSPFLGRLSLIKLAVPLAASGGSGAAGAMQRPSIFPQGPLPKQSALRQWAWPVAGPPAAAASAAAKKKQQLAAAAAATRKGLKPGQVGAPTSHNLVFHTRIKSSGYGPASSSASAGGKGPRALNLGGLHQKANSTAGRAFLAGQKKATGGAGAASPAVATPSYPLTCGPINVFSPHNAPSKSPPLHNGPIVSLSFSSDAKRLLSASLDSTAASVRIPPWKHPQGTAHLIGHKKPLRCASWAWINPSATPAADSADVLALTSSADGTARMWALGRADPILVFDRSKRNEPVTASSLAAGSAAASSAIAPAGSSDNPLFTADIAACSFFRQNQLVLLLHRSSLLLYKYHLDPFKTNTDLKKLQNLNKYKRLSSWESSSGAQSLTALGCVNSFLSTLVVVGDSLRGLSLVDLATNQTSREIKEAHGKAVHAITMNAPFSGAGQMGEEALESAQLFLSLSMDNAIKLWDIRSAECARKFTGHVCRSAPVRASFSPCGRYIASGSEDGRAYVFDIRNGNVVDKLSGATDVVSDVAYHPLHPQVVTSCYDGRIRFYSSA